MEFIGIKKNISQVIERSSKSYSEVFTESQNVEYIELDWNELERVLGKGLVKGSLLLLAGEPGVGKSTLILEIIKKGIEGSSKNTFLYISGEESEGQISQRAKRIGIPSVDRFILYCETDISKVLAEIEMLKPDLVIIDSVQTMMNIEITSAAGSIGQVKDITQKLIERVKKLGITTMVIGHIAKDGNIAGPKVLEHMVDVVLYFEKSNDKEVRVLKTNKNRFGASDLEGYFKMDNEGIKTYSFEEELGSLCHNNRVAGHVLGITGIDSRASIYQVQSLLKRSSNPFGKRVANGVDLNHLYLLIATIEKRLKINFDNYDIYIDVKKKAKNKSRESDLSICASLISSYFKRSLQKKFYFYGEVDLSGEVISMTREGAKYQDYCFSCANLEELYSIFDRAC